MDMLAKAITICALVAVGAHLIAAEGWDELKVKLDHDRALLKAEFKANIREYFLKAQNEADKFIVENYRGRSNVNGANGYKKTSVLFAEFETKKYAALQMATDVTEKIYSENYGKKFEICENDLKFDEEVFEVLRQRTRSQALTELYKYEAQRFDQIKSLRLMSHWKPFGDKVAILVQKMLAERDEAVVEGKNKMIKTQDDFCNKYELKNPSSLVKELDILIMKAAGTDICATRHRSAQGAVICLAEFHDLFKDYFGSKLLEDIDNCDSEVMDTATKKFVTVAKKAKATEDSHNVNEGDDYFFKESATTSGN